MADYLAMVRIAGSMAPCKMTYSASNVMEAIQKMTDISKVGSTNAILEFEIMELVDGGKGYKLAASKGISKTRGAELPVVQDDVSEKLPDSVVMEEKVYTPYQVAKM